MLRPDKEGIVHKINHNLTTKDVDANLLALSDEDRASIKYLSLDRNQLDAVPASISMLTNLERLFLGDNRIRHLPEWIGNLTCLTWIEINNNRLKTLPNSIGNLVQLESLYAQNNYCMGRLPSSMLKLTNLRTLSLYNSIFRLPDHLRSNTINHHHDTQQLLREIAAEEWRVKTREATAVWMLGGHQTTVHRDVRNMISGMIYETRQEDVWEEVVEEEAENKDKIKKTKI